MDTYRGVAFGVESAWPAFVYDSMRTTAGSRILAALARLFGRN